MRFGEKTIYLVIGIVLLTLGLVACGPAQDPDDEAATAPAEAAGEPEEAQESEAASESAEVVAPEQPSAPEVSEGVDFDVYGGLGEAGFETTASGLQIAIKEEGDGETPEVVPDQAVEGGGDSAVTADAEGAHSVDATANDEQPVGDIAPQEGTSTGEPPASEGEAPARA